MATIASGRRMPYMTASPQTPDHVPSPARRFSIAVVLGRSVPAASSFPSFPAAIISSGT